MKYMAQLLHIKTVAVLFEFTKLRGLLSFVGYLCRESLWVAWVR